MYARTDVKADKHTKKGEKPDTLYNDSLKEEKTII